MKSYNSGDEQMILAPYGKGTYGQPFVRTSSDFYLAAALGAIPNISTTHVFGLGDNLQTTDGEGVIWDGSGTSIPGGRIPAYTFSTSADIDKITSTSASDTSAITIIGLDTNWDLVTQTVTLTGQATVTLGTPLIRVIKVYNHTGTDLVGYVFLSVNHTYTTGIPDDPTKVRAIMQPGNNTTQMALYSVPASHKLVINHGWATLAGKNINVGAALIIKQRDFGSVPQKLHTAGLLSSGSSQNNRPYELPIVFNPKSDLWYTSSVSANGTAVSAGFHGMLVKTVDLNLAA